MQSGSSRRGGGEVKAARSKAHDKGLKETLMIGKEYNGSLTVAFGNRTIKQSQCGRKGGMMGGLKGGGMGGKGNYYGRIIDRCLL